MGKPYDKAVRNRRGTHISRIIKLHVLEPIARIFVQAMPATRVPPNHPTTQVPTRSTHPTAQVPTGPREDSAPSIPVVDVSTKIASVDGEPVPERRCTHTRLFGMKSCWVCGLLGRNQP